MHGMGRKAWFTGILLLAVACGGEKKETPSTVQVRMSETADLSADFFAQPFPLETRRLETKEGKHAGGYDLRGFPNPISNSLVEVFKKTMGPDLKGYGTNAAVYFSFTGDLTYENAVTGPAESRSGEAAILLVNIDSTSPDYLRFVPVYSRFYRGEGDYLPPYTLALAPMPGFPLRERSLYAALVLRGRGLEPVSGSLRQAAPLADALAGKGPWGETFGPLRLALAQLGIAADDLLAATVYATRDVTGPLFGARDWLYAEGPTAQAKVDPATLGFYTSLNLVKGSFRGVRFQHGTPPYDNPGEGAFILRADGVPSPAGEETLRFALTLPKGTPPDEGWPLVIYAHGTGGDYDSFVWREGWVLAAEGIAVVSYDQPYHGTRHPRFAEGSGCVNECPQLYTFNFLNPPAGRDGFRQSALDAVQLMRGMMDVRFKLTPSGPVQFFDPARVSYMGHSQGSTSGPLFVAAQGPEIGAAVFSGPAGGLHLSFLYKYEPVDIPAVARFLLGAREGFDLFHPVLNLFQAYSEPADPLNHARYMALEPRGGAVRDLLITSGLLDGYTPPVQADAFAAAAGVPLANPVYHEVAPLELMGLAPQSPPLEGNRTALSGAAWTGGYLQFPDDGHFAVYDHPVGEQAYADFLRSKAYGGTGRARIEDLGARDEGAR